MIATDHIRKISQSSYHSKPPLFCVPGLFGSPYYFTQLSIHLGIEQPFYSWQQANSWESSFPFYRLEILASQYVSSLKKIQPQPPYYLAGHSFGGLVAFEMARQLSISGEKVALVAILDTTAPIASQKANLTKFINSANNLDYLNLIKEMFESDFGELVPTHFYQKRDSIHAVTSFESIFAQIREFSLLLNFREVIQMERIFSVFKNNMQSMLNYTPLKITQIPLVLYRADEKTYEKLNHTLFLNRLINSSTYGWNELTDNIKVCQTPGNHSTMLTSPYVQTLANLLRSQLN